MSLKFKYRFCNPLWVLVHHKTLIQYFKDQHIPKDLANKQKNHSKYLVGPAIEVEVPPVTGCPVPPPSPYHHLVPPPKCPRVIMTLLPESSLSCMLGWPALTAGPCKYKLEQHHRTRATLYPFVWCLRPSGRNIRELKVEITNWW